MAQLIINQDATLRNYLEAFRLKFSASQWKYFVTVLMGLLHCNGSKTLSGMLQQVAVVVTMSGLSRFLISPAGQLQPWSRCGTSSFKHRCDRAIYKPNSARKRSVSNGEDIR